MKNPIERKNLFDDIPEKAREEIFTDLLVTDSFRLERIVSQGQSSPDGFWYDQDDAEWVVLLRGAAGMRFEGLPEIVELRPGDYVHIRPHVRHRVDWTAKDEDTVWLAVRYCSKA